MIINNSITIIGAPGAGKSSVAKSLSKMLGLHFYDMDEEIEKKYGITTEWLIEIEGTEGLINKTLPLIKTIFQRKNIILATNSEAMASEAVRAEIGANSIVVYLHKHPHASPSTAVLTEPLIQHAGEHLHSMYLKAADIAVDTYKKNINMLTEEIVNTILRNKHESTLS